MWVCVVLWWQCHTPNQRFAEVATKKSLSVLVAQRAVIHGCLADERREQRSTKHALNWIHRYEKDTQES